MKEIKSTAIIGMGALGMLYADKILSACEADSSYTVTFAAEADRIAKYKNMSFTVNGRPRQFPIADCTACLPADLVIVAVKYNALPSALNTMARCIGPDTTVISVMNGITSEEIIGERFGSDKVIPCIAQGMDAVKFGGNLTYSKPGELRIGILKPSVTANPDHNPDHISPEAQSKVPVYISPQDRLNALTRFLDRCGIAYTVEDDILYRLWGKFMLNVGVNQTCMAFETNYGGSLAPGKAYETMVGAMREVIALANLEGIRLTEADLESYIELIRTLSPEGMPSMRQDAISHRLTEVEMFSGTVKDLAAGHGLPVPVNEWLYNKIKDLEAAY